MTTGSTTAPLARSSSRAPRSLPAPTASPPTSWSSTTSAPRPCAALQRATGSSTSWASDPTPAASCSSSRSIPATTLPSPMAPASTPSPITASSSSKTPWCPTWAMTSGKTPPNATTSSALRYSPSALTRASPSTRTTTRPPVPWRWAWRLPSRCCWPLPLPSSCAGSSRASSRAWLRGLRLPASWPEASFSRPSRTCLPARM